MSNESTAAEAPLSGVRVLDIATFVAAPFAGACLAEFGADVIKIEKPDAGDSLRHLGVASEVGDEEDRRAPIHHVLHDGHIRIPGRRGHAVRHSVVGLGVSRQMARVFEGLPIERDDREQRGRVDTRGALKRHHRSQHRLRHQRAR